MIVEGPNSWTDLETRGDLGAEHMKDYQTNIAPNVEKSTPQLYATYEPEASTVASGAYSPTKTLITHITVKPGRGPAELATLRSWKKVWEKRGLNVVVWNLFYSGEPGYIVSVRLKNGWKDLDLDGPTSRQAADEIGGPGTYDRLQEEASKNIANTVNEMIEFQPDLSSK
jgi:hypothetical protein